MKVTFRRILCAVLNQTLSHKMYVKGLGSTRSLQRRHPPIIFRELRFSPDTICLKLTP